MADYGYCRISTSKQNIERQVRNIKAKFPNAIIIKETFTGTKFDGRKDLDNLLKIIKPKDRLIFDSASRLGRDAEAATNLYEELFQKDIELIFLKEPQVNSEIYRKALDNQISVNLNTGNKATDALLITIIEALNKYTIEVAKQQIRLVFEQAEKEVTDLHQRTSEGILTAKLNGKRVGLPKGSTIKTKKSLAAKELIQKHSKDFGGTLSDDEVIKLAEISRNTFYKYKKELRLGI